MLTRHPQPTLCPYTTLFRSANDDYWGGVPALKRILIRHVAEPGTQRLLLSKGDGDAARDLSPDDLKDLDGRSEEQTSELQSREKLVCRLLLEKKKECRTCLR